MVKKLKPSKDRAWLKYYSKEAIEFELPKKTIYQCVYDNNKDCLSRTALEYYGRKISYEEFFYNVEKTVKAFRAIGVKKGDIITISSITTPEIVYTYYALSRIGAISNMVDPRTNAEGIKHYITEVDSKIVISLDLFYDKVLSIIPDTNVKKTITLSVSDSFPVKVKAVYNSVNTLKKFVGKAVTTKTNVVNLKWKDFIDNGSLYIGDIDEPYQEDNAVTIVHTGGTTGFPKGVLLSNDALNAVAYQYKNSGLHFFPGKKFFNIMPPFIAYGVGCGMHMPLVIGMTSVCVPAFNPKKYDELILKMKPDHIAGVFSHWENLIKSKKLQNADLSFWITPAVGGDAMNVELEKKANKFLKDHKAPNSIVKGYGITEECSLAAASINHISKVGSVGIPMPQINISVFEPGTDKELSYNEVGEICINTPTMMLGYYDNEEATNQIIKKHRDGKKWVHTQDYGYLDEDGFLFIEGRIKRIIVRQDGFKVFPFIIEKTILQHSAVKECMVVGVPDTEYIQGNIPKAHIVLKDETKENISQIEQEIKDLCNKNLPEYVVPSYYHFRDSMPLTPIGKIDFKALEQEDVIESKESGK